MAEEQPYIRLSDDPEFMKWLQENFTDATWDKGDEVAAKVRARVPEDVEVHVNKKYDRNGRPTAVVTIAHPSGMARQAKDGVLTRAAAEAGVDVVRYPEGGA